MGWLGNFFGGGSKAKREATLKEVREKFSLFRGLLDRHNQILKRISALEEKHQNHQLAGISDLWDEFILIREGVSDLVARMIELGGEDYLPLRGRLEAVSKQVENLLPEIKPAPQDEFIIPFSGLGKERAASVGDKSANLGEMKSRLGLPVPDGFAISAWAYRHFIDVHNLQQRISRLLKDVRIRKYEDLEVVSEEIQELVNLRPVPEDLAEAVFTAFDELVTRSAKSGFALRSSAVGEDTSFSFAGQYRSFMNVRRETLLDRYKEILASKFTPSAIYYLLGHALSEMNLAMGVICMEMVDPIASGVIYTRDPVNPSADHLLVNSIFGLGSFLVEGVLTPDVFHVLRSNGQVVFSRTASKPVQLRLRPGGGVESVAIPAPDQERPSLSEDELRELAGFALKVEDHYGGPQDIEWALDRSGELFLLQARPLKLTRPKSAIQVPKEFLSSPLLAGGTPICPGVGVGPIFHLTSVEDLGSVPQGAVLVTPNPSPKLVAVMAKISALVTMVGGSASHMATLAREMSLPTIVDLPGAAKIPSGRQVTVDAGHGVIYDGAHPEWITAPEKQPATAEDPGLEEKIKDMMAPIAHLNAIHPQDPEFTVENCRTLHDISRFIHQKSMEVMFSTLKQTSDKDNIGLRLKTKIPLLINIIYLDREDLGREGKRWVQEDAIASLPMQALWQGVLQEGWPETTPPSDLKGFLAVVGSNLQEGRPPEFSENSYAFLSHEYMLLNLRMGYHFSTIEAMATAEPAKNYIRMQFKLGGAPLERRIRRIWLISNLLRLMNFENASQGDFLDSTMSYQGEAEVLERLRLLGRITILTKQLDMTLSSDARANWYFDDLSRKLGFKNQGASDGDEVRG
jgi:pyruvate,water dikinase